jgi:hypothetical protein
MRHMAWIGWAALGLAMAVVHHNAPAVDEALGGSWWWWLPVLPWPPSPSAAIFGPREAAGPAARSDRDQVDGAHRHPVRGLPIIRHYTP